MERRGDLRSELCLLARPTSLSPALTVSCSSLVVSCTIKQKSASKLNLQGAGAEQVDQSHLNERSLCVGVVEPPHQVVNRHFSRFAGLFPLQEMSTRHSQNGDRGKLATFGGMDDADDDIIHVDGRDSPRPGDEPVMIRPDEVKLSQPWQKQLLRFGLQEEAEAADDLFPYAYAYLEYIILFDPCRF